MKKPIARIVPLCVVMLGAAVIGYGANAGGPSNSYLQHNLVADTPGVADVTDPNLVNAWGISESSTSPFWISDNGPGLTTLYTTSGAIIPLVVTVAPAKGQTGAATPTGQIFNSTQAFVLANGKPASFIFVTEDGTVSAWNGGAITTLEVDNSASGAVYKGLALGANPSGPLLYAANFNAGTVDVFDGTFKPAKTEGSFTDPNLPAGYAPFNIAALNGKLYISYALQDSMKHSDVPGAGNGLVDIFDMDGNYQARLISNGALNSPWGMVISPAGFGAFGNALLVGNFGDGWINAFDPNTGAMLGSLQDIRGKVIAIDGLWALIFGNGGNGGAANTLYFTAGPDKEQHGLFGSLAAAPPVSPNVINSASNLAGPIAPGEAVTLKGTNLGPATLVAGMIPASGSLATSLASTSVTVNGTAAPIIYASATQTAILVPFATAGSTSANIVVTYNGGTPVTFLTPVTPTAPGIFSMDSSGGGQAVAFNQDGSLNSKTNGATLGEVITIYATGAGMTEPAGQDGLVEGDIFRTTVALTSMTIGGKAAQVIYSGSAPGELSGIMQVEAVIPAGVTAGAAPVVLTIGQEGSQTNATIFVQAPATAAQR